MTKCAKEYMNAVIETLQTKYNMTEIEAYKAVKSSFLYDSLLYYVDETIEYSNAIVHAFQRFRAPFSGK